MSLRVCTRIVTPWVVLFGALNGQLGLVSAQTRYQPGPDQSLMERFQGNTAAASLRSLDETRKARPGDLDAALAYARAAFELGLTEGDLRWWGRARAALAPWWSQPDLSAEGHFMRALVLQGFHQFGPALQELARAIALEPGRAELWSWRFALHLLLADMASARQDCEALARQVSEVEAEPCRAILLYRSGQPQAGIDLLRRSIQRPEFAGPLAQDWLRFHWGEAHRVAGQVDQAVLIWESYLRQRPQSHAVRLALAEALNQLGRHQRALEVSDQRAPSDALLVQQLLARQGLRDGQIERWAQKIQWRWDSQDRRQEALIERPRLIFLVRYGQDVKAGLELAARNWTEQKEPADGILFLEAALKLDQPARAEAVVWWAKETGYKEPALIALIARARSHPNWGQR